MDLRVKQFIEENIDLIESEDWKEFLLDLINSRYNTIVPNFIYLTLHILDESDIDYSSLFGDIKKTALREILNYLVSMNSLVHKLGAVFSTEDPGVVDFIKVAGKLGYSVYQYIDGSQHFIIKPGYSLKEFLEFLQNYQDTVPPESEFTKIF